MMNIMVMSRFPSVQSYSKSRILANKNFKKYEKVIVIENYFDCYMKSITMMKGISVLV